MTIVPISRPPSISGLMIPTMTGKAIGEGGSIIALSAEPVTMSIDLAVLGPGRPLHDPGDLAELSPHLLHDLSADATDRLHGKRGEEERHHADEEARDHPRIGEREGDGLEAPVTQAARVLVEQDQARRGRPSRSRSPW